MNGSCSERPFFFFFGELMSIINGHFGTVLNTWLLEEPSDKISDLLVLALLIQFLLSIWIASQELNLSCCHLTEVWPLSNLQKTGTIVQHVLLYISDLMENLVGLMYLRLELFPIPNAAFGNICYHSLHMESHWTSLRISFIYYNFAMDFLSFAT